MLKGYLQKQCNSQKQALERIWVVGRNGLITTSSKTSHELAEYARDHKEIESWNSTDKDEL